MLLPAGDARECRVYRDEIEVEVTHGDALAHAADHLLDNAPLAVGLARGGDVACGAADASGASILVAFDDLAAHQNPDPAVMAETNTLFGFEQGRAVVDVVVELLGDDALVIRMDVFPDQS